MLRSNRWLRPFIDSEEWSRLYEPIWIFIGVLTVFRDKQHIALAIAMGGLYPEPDLFRAVLAPQGDSPKMILDVGVCDFEYCDAF